MPIFKVSYGKNIGGLVNYLYEGKKVPFEDPITKELDHELQPERVDGYETNLIGDNRLSWAAQMRDQSDLSKRCEQPYMHVSLSFDPNDPQQKALSTQDQIEFAKSWLKEAGLDDHQWLAVVHGDTQHPHVHIVINRVGDDGTTKDWNRHNDFRRGRELLRSVEQQWGLNAPEHKHDLNLDRSNLERPKRGEVDWKTDIQTKVNHAIGTSDGTWASFEEQLKELGVELKANSNGTGLSYRINDLEDENGNPLVFKASKVGKKFQKGAIEERLNQRAATFIEEQLERPGGPEESVEEAAEVERRLESIQTDYQRYRLLDQQIQQLELRKKELKADRFLAHTEYGRNFYQQTNDGPAPDLYAEALAEPLAVNLQQVERKLGFVIEHDLNFFIDRTNYRPDLSRDFWVESLDDPGQRFRANQCELFRDVHQGILSLKDQFFSNKKLPEQEPMRLEAFENDPKRATNAIDYLKARGLTDETIAKIPGLRFKPRVTRDSQDAGPAILWNTSNGNTNGRLINPPEGIQKGINYGPMKGAYFCTIAENEFDPDKPLFVVEGAIDALSLQQQGYQAIATLSASNALDWKAKYEHPILFNANRVVFALDNDQAGHRGIVKNLNNMDKSDVSWLPWPKDERGKSIDANDLLRAGKLDEYLKSAELIKLPAGCQHWTTPPWLENREHRLDGLIDDILRSKDYTKGDRFTSMSDWKDFCDNYNEAEEEQKMLKGLDQALEHRQEVLRQTDTLQRKFNAFLNANPSWESWSNWRHIKDLKESLERIPKELGKEETPEELLAGYSAGYDELLTPLKAEHQKLKESIQSELGKLNDEKLVRLFQSELEGLSKLGKTDVEQAIYEMLEQGKLDQLQTFRHLQAKAADMAASQTKVPDITLSLGEKRRAVNQGRFYFATLVREDQINGIHHPIDKEESQRVHQKWEALNKEINSVKAQLAEHTEVIDNLHNKDLIRDLFLAQKYEHPKKAAELLDRLSIQAPTSVQHFHQLDQLNEKMANLQHQLAEVKGEKDFLSSKISTRIYPNADMDLARAKSSAVTAHHHAQTDTIRSFQRVMETADTEQQKMMLGLRQAYRQMESARGTQLKTLMTRTDAIEEHLKRSFKGTSQNEWESFRQSRSQQSFEAYQQSVRKQLSAKRQLQQHSIGFFEHRANLLDEKVEALSNKELKGALQEMFSLDEKLKDLLHQENKLLDKFTPEQKEKVIEFFQHQIPPMEILSGKSSDIKNFEDLVSIREEIEELLKRHHELQDIVTEEQSKKRSAQLNPYHYPFQPTRVHNPFAKAPTPVPTNSLKEEISQLTAENRQLSMDLQQTMQRIKKFGDPHQIYTHHRFNQMMTSNDFDSMISFRDKLNLDRLDGFDRKLGRIRDPLDGSREAIDELVSKKEKLQEQLDNNHARAAKIRTILSEYQDRRFNAHNDVGQSLVDLKTDAKHAVNRLDARQAELTHKLEELLNPEQRDLLKSIDQLKERLLVQPDAASREARQLKQDIEDISQELKGQLDPTAKDHAVSAFSKQASGSYFSEYMESLFQQLDASMGVHHANRELQSLQRFDSYFSDEAFVAQTFQSLDKIKGKQPSPTDIDVASLTKELEELDKANQHLSNEIHTIDEKIAQFEPEPLQSFHDFHTQPTSSLKHGLLDLEDQIHLDQLSSFDKKLGRLRPPENYHQVRPFLEHKDALDEKLFANQARIRQCHHQLRFHHAKQNHASLDEMHSLLKDKANLTGFVDQLQIDKRRAFTKLGELTPPEIRPQLDQLWSISELIRKAPDPSKQMEQLGQMKEIGREIIHSVKEKSGSDVISMFSQKAISNLIGKIERSVSDQSQTKSSLSTLNEQIKALDQSYHSGRKEALRDRLLQAKLESFHQLKELRSTESKALKEVVGKLGSNRSKVEKLIEKNASAEEWNKLGAKLGNAEQGLLKQAFTHHQKAWHANKQHQSIKNSINQHLKQEAAKQYAKKMMVSRFGMAANQLTMRLAVMVIASHPAGFAALIAFQLGKAAFTAKNLSAPAAQAASMGGRSLISGMGMRGVAGLVGLAGGPAGIAISLAVMIPQLLQTKREKEHKLERKRTR